MQGGVSYSYGGRQPHMSRVRLQGRRADRQDRANIPPDGGLNDYLCHHGIPGMKWGVRRYQNEDGSYTEEGKRRYGRDSTPESKTWKKSDASNLSDEELRRRNNRMQQERQYRDLTTSESERNATQLKNEIKKDFLKKALILPVVGITAYAATKVIKNNGTKAVDMIEHFGKKKIAGLKAASMLKKTLKNANVPHMGQYNPLRDAAAAKHPEWTALDLRRIQN